ncbi:MAG TPA: NAD(P)H-binding protein [Microlunatus sp.]|nr:NAD(P)H-binding protein [Microlunatus sp.]
MMIMVAGGTGLAGRALTTRAVSAGHQVRVLSRRPAPAASGVEVVVGDLATGSGLTSALDSVDAVIDLSNIVTRSYRIAERFFTAATRNLIAAEHAAGVSRHVLLSIVGVDAFPGGYYRAKVAQEQALAAAAGSASVQHIIARVTQFHDFAAQTYRSFRFGPAVLAPPLHLRPVHLDDVADHLLRLLTSEQRGRADDLAGPEPLNLLDMTRRYAKTQPRPVPVLALPLPPTIRRANEARVLAPAGQTHGARTFDHWLQQQRQTASSTNLRAGLPHQHVTRR